MIDEDEPIIANEGALELYPAIVQGGYQIVVTDLIRREYARATKDEGIPIVLIEPVLDYLKDNGSLVEPNLRGGRVTYRGIPQKHSVFPVTAILAKAEYLITENPAWRRRADTISDYGPTVVTPGRFIQLEGR